VGNRVNPLFFFFCIVTSLGTKTKFCAKPKGDGKIKLQETVPLY